MPALQTIRERAATLAEPVVKTTLSPALEIYFWSRAALWAAVVFAYTVFETRREIPTLAGLTPVGAPAGWEPPWLRDLGYGIDVWARWDSAWFLRIAEHGYASAANAPAFFPLYPGLVGVLGRALGGHFVLAGVIVSFAAALGAFVLLHRLAEERLGYGGARRAVLYLAVFPMTLFLQAVYSESMFLLLALATFVLAERGRFVPAAVAAGLALLTRPLGIALLPSLALFAWRARDRVRALASLALVPVVFAAYPLGLAWQVGDPWAFLRAELDPLWARDLSPLGPLGGLWDGLRAGVAGVRQLFVGNDGTNYWPYVEDFSPVHVAVVNLENLAFLVLYSALAAVAWRRFGAPYGLFCAVSLAIPLSIPSERWPLLSMPRFGLVLFPCFLALAWLGARPRLHGAIVGVSSLALGIVAAQWALWQWVS